MKFIILIELMVSVTVGCYAHLLGIRAANIRHQIAVAESTIDAGEKQGFTVPAGMDTSGHFVAPMLHDDKSSSVVFVVRASNASTDLAFWSTVELLIRRNPGRRIKLFGYCDGMSCVDYIRSLTSPPTFPVLAYSDVGNFQAILNADAQGTFLLKGSKQEQIQWRTASQTPTAIAERIIQ